MINANGIIIDRGAKTISHAGVTDSFDDANGNASRKGFKRYDAVVYLILAGGASREQAFWHLYANDVDGGPLAGPAVISVWLSQLKPRLLKLQLEIRHTRIAGVMFYEIVPIFQLRKKNWRLMGGKWGVAGFGIGLPE